MPTFSLLQGRVQSRLLKSGVFASLCVGLSACGVTHSPEEPALNLNRQADLAYQSGDWGQAENYYLQLTENTPEDASAWLRMGNMRLRQENFIGAVDAYHEASSAPDADAKTHYNLATSYLMLARESLEEAKSRLPEEDLGKFVIEARLQQFEDIIEGPIAGVTLPATGVFR